MAKRRAIGRALSRAGASFSDLADAMLRARIQEESQMRQFGQQDKLLRERERLQSQRQTDLAKLQHQQQMEQDKLEHPEAEFESGTRLAAPIAQEIDRVTDIKALPTREGITSRMGAREAPIPIPFGGFSAETVQTRNRPEIESLVAQAGSKRKEIEQEIARLAAERDRTTPQIGPEGAQGFYDTSGNFRNTERTTPQQGAREAGIERTTRPGAVARAGATTGAQVGATIDAKAGRLDDLAAIAEAEHVESGGAGAGGQQAESAKIALARFKELVKEVNQWEGPEQVVEGGKKMVKSWGNLDNAMTEYQKRRMPLAMQLTVLIQGSRPTDTDVLIAGGLIPDWRTPKTVADNLLSTIDDILTRTGGRPGSISREELFKQLEDARDGKNQIPLNDVKRMLGGR
jgi:hypothetical protein